MERPEFDRLLTAHFAVIEASAKKYARIYRFYHEWEDLLQTALLKMLRFADLYNPDKGELLPWACVIICNTIKTRITQSMTMPNMEELNALIIDCTPAPYDCDPLNDLQLAFITANINQETQLFADGYTYAEIAKLQGFSSKVTAKNRIDKCADRLSRILGFDKTPGRRVRNVAVTDNIF